MGIYKQTTSYKHNRIIQDSNQNRSFTTLTRIVKFNRLVGLVGAKVTKSLSFVFFYVTPNPFHFLL